ncbi:MAG: MFS transporter [Candidatus Lightella neohaematopini]|nr:MFS transporter [Candidatus Lightella neohaematopini]
MDIRTIRIIIGTCVLFTIRIISTFVLLPIITSYGKSFNTNDLLIGISISIYSIIQMICQVPFGIAADKFNRKNLIVLGLIIFIFGNIIIIKLNNIIGLIIGRGIQGISAISPVIMSIIHNSISDKYYTIAMMCLGISFLISFIISIVFGPIITELISFNALFIFITILSLLGIIITYLVIPDIKSDSIVRNKPKLNIISIIFNKNLVLINFSIFCLHILLVSNFITIPYDLVKIGINYSNHWKVYLYSTSSFIITFILINIFNKYKYKILYILINFIIVFLISILLKTIIFSKLLLIISIQLFFISFSMIEAILPQLLRQVTTSIIPFYDGTLLGLYSTNQFLGSAIGGLISGLILHITRSVKFVLFINVVILLLWLFVIIKNFNKLKKNNL